MNQSLKKMYRSLFREKKIQERKLGKILKINKNSAYDYFMQNIYAKMKNKI